MRYKLQPSAVRARRVPLLAQGIPLQFIFVETVTSLQVLPNGGTCSLASVLRFNDRSAPRPWRRGARR
ncbi:hypothetical protein D9M73_107150 [compost metagenome]|jgi:hypothetical protein